MTNARQPRAERFVALDSLRGLAAVAVMLFHIGNFGWLGGFDTIRHAWLLVDFFFVLSGFVIAASYGERLAQGYPAGNFMALRLGRVVPLHAAVVAVFVVAEFLVFRPLLGEAHDTFYLWRGGLLLDGFAEHTGNFFAPVSWSISVEIVLYAAAALLFGKGRPALAIAGALAGAAAVALLTGWNHVGFGFLMQRGVLGFGIGVACYALHRRLDFSPSRRSLTIAELSVSAAAVAMMAWLPFAGRTILPLDLLFGAAVLVFARDGGAASRVLQTRPMVALGTLSYSIYMTHLIVVIALNRGLPRLFEALGRGDLIAARPSSFGLMTVELGIVWETLLVLAICAVVLAMSAFSYRWIEEPARRWTRRQVSARRAARTETAVAAI